MYCLFEKTENKLKRGRGWSLFKKDWQRRKKETRKENEREKDVEGDTERDGGWNNY